MHIPGEIEMVYMEGFKSKKIFSLISTLIRAHLVTIRFSNFQEWEKSEVFLAHWSAGRKHKFNVGYPFPQWKAISFSSRKLLPNTTLEWMPTTMSNPSERRLSTGKPGEPEKGSTAPFMFLEGYFSNYPFASKRWDLRHDWTTNGTHLLLYGLDMVQKCHVEID